MFRQTEMHTAEPLLPEPSPFLKLLLKNWKVISRQVLITFRQKWSKQDVINY